MVDAFCVFSPVGQEFLMRDEFFFDGAEEERFYEDQRQRRQYLSRRRHVLMFRFEKNPKTDKDQWQARCRDGGVTTVFVLHSETKQQITENDVWFCEEADTLFESKDLTFRVVAVRLKAKLFSGEVSLNFFLDERRLVAGKHPWNAYQSIGTDADGRYLGLTLLCSPCKFGTQPTGEQAFWICKYRKVIHLAARGNHIIVIVDLIREDIEAKERHLAKLAEEERQRKEAEVKLLEDQRREQEAWEAAQARAAQAAAPSPLEQNFPEIAARLRKLDRMQSDRPIQPSVPFTGGGCGSSYRPLPRRKKQW